MPGAQESGRGRFFVLRRLRRAGLALAGLALLTHCATNPVSNERDFVLVSEAEEVRLGAAAHADVLKTYPALEHPALQTYVAGIGQKLAAVSHRPALVWHFTVVDSPDVNAFALPGGYVYITRGLMAYLNSEAELAGVIGHEIAHVTARHGVRRQSTATVAGLGAVLGSIFIPGLANEAGATLMQSVAQAWVAGYGREHELEADRLGALYLARAGYDPQAMVDVIGVLKQQEAYAADRARREGRPARTYHGLFDTHPDNDRRLREVVAEARKHAVAAPRLERAAYLEQIDGLVFGDSPGQGVIRERAFLHEKLGIAMTFPAGWQIENRPERVLGSAAGGAAWVELVAGPRHDRPLDTLRAVRLDPGARFETGRLNGLPAAFAAGTISQRPALLAAVVKDGRQFLLAAVARDAATYARERGTLRETINSFRPFVESDRIRARPYGLRLVRADADTRIAALAAVSPLGAEAEAQLRLLNGLYPDGEPRRGEVLKIVETLAR